MEIDVKEDLLSDPSRKNTASIEKELNDYFDHDEGQKIKSDIELLISMGFDKKMVKKVYILFSPDNIERAIDYMTEIDGIYQHDFIASSNPKENLIDQPVRNSNVIEQEMESFLETEEGQHIKDDIELIKSMGFDKKMINKVYLLLRPENIERAIDYMTETDGIYQHDFIEGSNPNECFICKSRKNNHLDYIPDDLLNDDVNNNLINNIQQNNDLIIEEAINQENKNIKINVDNNIEECEVCYEEILKADKDLNSIPCGHLFCTHCWFNYLKTLILEAKVEKIKCMDHSCNQIVSEEFILNHINDNKNIVEKYDKFKKRAEIIKDKDKKLCPKADCDSFLKKTKKSKYVKCEHGHEYCFDCLNPPHGNKPCDLKLEKQFMKWKKGKRVKRCPRCQMYTEKNEGCNHMTCVSCKYQWCWLCEGEYKYEHYKSGICKGQQFTRADNLKEVLKYTNAFGLHKIFTCVFEQVNGPFDLDEYIWLKYLAILGFWLFGYGVLYSFVVFIYLEKNTNFGNDNCENFFIVMTCLIGLTLFASFQIIFTATVTPFIFISFIYHRFFDRLLIFYGIGENDRI